MKTPDNIKQDRESACQWARDLLQRSDVAIINVETADLYGPICEIGVIDTTGAVLFESLIYPGGIVSGEARALHGITDEMLLPAPTLKEAWDRLQVALVGSATLIAYSAAWTANRMRQSCAQNGLSPLTHRWLDVMPRYAAYCGNRKEAHQSYTFVKLPGATHRSIADARAVLACLQTMGRKGTL